jgi:hypothetical protein
MLINTAPLIILKFSVYFTITLIIVNVYVLKICKKTLLINLIITQGPASEAARPLPPHSEPFQYKVAAS